MKMKQSAKILAMWVVVAIMAAITPIGGSVALAKGGCDVTVTAGDGATAIQDAVNAASAGDKICLDGTFTTSEVSTVTVGTSNITIKSASPGVLDGGTGPAFRLADGLSNVTIESLEIKNRTGDRGGGIEAWDRTTTNITIRNNKIHDNEYSGVLVGSEGGFIHKNWIVRDNTFDNHGFAGIELTNCENCKIMHNSLTASGTRGIIVQARNTTAGSPKVEIHAVDVLHNVVDSTGDKYGIYVLTYEGITTLPFDPIGVMAELTGVTINNNTVSGIGDGEYGVRFWAYNSGTLARNATINHNVFTCTPTFGTGVSVEEDGSPGSTVENVKVMNNSISGCATAVHMVAGTGKEKNN